MKVDTDLVSLDVVVNDAAGRPVRNLRQEDFKVYVDGVEQPLTHAEGASGSRSQAWRVRGRVQPSLDLASETGGAVP